MIWIKVSLFFFLSANATNAHTTAAIIIGWAACSNDRAAVDDHCATISSGSTSTDARTSISATFGGDRASINGYCSAVSTGIVRLTAADARSIFASYGINGASINSNIAAIAIPTTADACIIATTLSVNFSPVNVHRAGIFIIVFSADARVISVNTVNLQGTCGITLALSVDVQSIAVCNRNAL